MAKAGAYTITDLIQIIYTSQPFGYDGATLNGILVDARRCNERDDVTGALMCRRDIFVQLLEGPEDAVNAAFARIGRDDRHLDITLRASGPVTERMFGDWAMLHDPADTLIWTPQEISDGAMDKADAAAFRAVFKGLAAAAATGDAS